MQIRCVLNVFISVLRSNTPVLPHQQNACKPGYFGQSCNSPCPVGYFGKHCGGICFPNCSEDKCDRVHGCQKIINISTEDILKTTYQERFQPSFTTTRQSKTFSSIYVTSSEKNGDPLNESDFNTAYVLHGLLGVLCLFLFVIVIHLCKKSKAKTKNVNDINNASDAQQQQQQQPENRISYDVISESATTLQIYRPLHSEYDEINEKVQIHNFRSSKPSSEMYEGPEISNRNPFPIHGITSTDSNALTKEHHTEKLTLCENMSGSIVPDLNSLDRNAYIDVI